MLEDPVEHAYDDLDEAVATVGRLNPTWSHGDVLAKAEGLTQFDEAAVRDDPDRERRLGRRPRRPG